MINDMIFILSDQFPYESMIPPDSGPQFASNLDLNCANVSEIEKYLDIPVVVDTRITEPECEIVKQFAKSNPNANIILKLGDPYEVRLGHFARMAYELTSYKNVRYISSYTYAENTKKIAEAVGEERILLLPYAFNKDLVSDRAFDNRKNKIILSGARFKHFYPLRRRMMKGLYRGLTPSLLIHTEILKHPGYPDIGDDKKHDIIGDSYVNFLSGYKFMLVTASVYDIELLKYVECAYAGCVPVGEPSSSLPDSVKQLVQPITLKKSIGQQVRKIINSDKDYSEVARNYRQLMTECRDKNLLRSSLLEFALKVK